MDNLSGSLLPPEVLDPRLLLSKQKKNLESVQQHWADFDRREFSWASKGLLVLAVMQLICVAVYDVFLYESDCSVFGSSEEGCAAPGTERRTYISVCIAIAMVFQSYLCVTGVIFENLPMLIMANLNATVVIVRMYVSNKNITSDVFRITPVVISGVLSGVTILFSLFAGSKFGRLMYFTISSNEEILRLYKRYQFVQALLVLDAQFAAMTMATAFQFEHTLGEWDTVIAVVVCVAVAVINLSLIYHIRLENKGPIFLFSFLSAGFLVYAVYSSTPWITSKGADYEVSKTLAFLSLVLTVLSRVVLIIAIFYTMYFDYDQGLRECLCNEETRVATNITNRNEKLFLAEGEEPPPLSSEQVSNNA